MFDLHIHSNCSDGSDDYITILKNAEKLGLKYISITDHDNCKVYEAINKDDIKKYFSGTLITGVELQAYILGFSIELLGYFVDYKIINEEVKKIYKPFEEINNEELKRLYEKCVDIGMKFDEDILEKYKDSGIYYATEYLHNEMKRNEYNRQFVPDKESWERESVFFKRHTSNINSPFHINEDDLIPSVEKTIEIIKKAGGKVFIPHIYQYEENADNILNELINKYKIDGIECYYPSFSKEQSTNLIKICKERNLFISAGSDYHGNNRPNVFLGKVYNNSIMQSENIENWIKNI